MSISKEQAAKQLIHKRAIAGTILAEEVESIISIMPDSQAKEELKRVMKSFRQEAKAARDEHEKLTGKRHL